MQGRLSRISTRARGSAWVHWRRRTLSGRAGLGFSAWTAPRLKSLGNQAVEQRQGAPAPLGLRVDARALAGRGQACNSLTFRLLGLA